MKIEIGKTKIRGFKFKHLTEGVVWNRKMENYIEKEGVIMSIHHEHIYQLMRVKFDDGNSYAFPLEMAKQYIINKETTSENDAVDSILYSIGVPYNKLMLDCSQNQNTIGNTIPTFLIGGYTSPNQNEVNRKMSESCKRIAEEINRIVTKHQNRNNMKNLKITAPEGYEIDKVNSTFENIVFKEIKKELPKSLSELGEIVGYYTNGFGQTTKKTCSRIETHNLSTQLFATKEQAEASLALAQLSQLREVYRDGWKPDWSDGKLKYVIAFELNCLQRFDVCNCSEFLSFQSAEVRDLFLENFRDLIEQAKPLMS